MRANLEDEDIYSRENIQTSYIIIKKSGISFGILFEIFATLINKGC